MNLFMLLLLVGLLVLGACPPTPGMPEFALRLQVARRKEPTEEGPRLLPGTRAGSRVCRPNRVRDWSRSSVPPQLLDRCRVVREGRPPRLSAARRTHRAAEERPRHALHREVLDSPNPLNAYRL